MLNLDFELLELEVGILFGRMKGVVFFVIVLMGSFICIEDGWGDSILWNLFCIVLLLFWK